ncbi:hypothetical protein GCM10011390_44860 [Aureimonas endophytica]|uniref:Uncharacterized protein n=1 Tax=Aureimonas endophytica TaxID=2027858 RepID=A0A917A018_9HYPH|nr:hypothetical protein [Aureimonas endophytica]GGE20585.1 hypothetical protein GCM10011390_44860 [Aureimonas endophytica]
MKARLVLLAGFVCLLSAEAGAQPFDPGPPGIVPGSSMSGARIDGAPAVRRAPRVKGAEIFGDTAAERAYGREFDDSYLRPRVPREGRERSTESRATEGRSDLNSINAGEFATEGPNAIGASPVTRGSSFGRGGRARIVPNR